MKVSEILTSQCHWDRTESIPAGGTGSGNPTISGIKGSGESAFQGLLYADIADGPHQRGEIHPPPYMQMRAIKNKRFFELFCKSLQVVAYIGLSENLTKKSLNEIVDQVRDSLNQASPPKVILMTTGTDAMEQTASYINKELGDLIREKGVKLMLTGANRSMYRDDTDLWGNIEFAFESGHREDIIPGVYVAFHNRLIPADLVVKEPFNGIEMNYISREDPLYWRQVSLQGDRDYQTILRLKGELGYDREAAKSIICYPANIIRENHNDFRELVRSRFIRAVLLVLYHSSTANTLDDEPEISVAKLAEDLMNDGVDVLAVTENGEPVNLTATAYETSVALANAGVKGLGNMSKYLAFYKMRMCAPGSRDDFLNKMSTSYVGEFALPS